MKTVAYLDSDQAGLSILSVLSDFPLLWISGIAFGIDIKFPYYHCHWAMKASLN
jgi:hypothetical protein